MLRPAIYAASVIDHCRGLRHGVWLHADVSTDELNDGISEMLRRSPTGRQLGEPIRWWSIRNFAGFGTFSPTQQNSEPRLVTAVARGIVRHGYGFAAWASRVSGNPGLLDRFEEHYLGEFDSVEAYAAAQLPEHPVPTPALVTSFAHHLEASGELTVVRGAGGVWLFRPHAESTRRSHKSDQGRR